MAQKISHTLEDLYFDEGKRKLFDVIFNKYLSSVDPDGAMEPYDAIVKLGRNSLDEFDCMVQELKDQALIIDE
jgi:hypothetical protein